MQKKKKERKTITLGRLWTITFCSWWRRERRRRLGQRHRRELRQAWPRSSILWRRGWHEWTVAFWPLASRQSRLCSNQISSPCRARAWDVSMPYHRTYPSISPCTFREISIYRVPFVFVIVFSMKMKIHFILRKIILRGFLKIRTRKFY